MATTYQLWDNASSNLIEAYDTEREALDYVIEEVEAFGQDAVQAWALLRDDETGPVVFVAQGADLIRCAAKPTPVFSHTPHHD